MEINELISKSINGDEDACAKVLEHYDVLMNNYALKVTNQKYDLAQDIAQLARIRVFKSIKTFKCGSSFNSWVYMIIKNLYIDYIRGLKSNICSLDEFNEVFSEDDSAKLLPKQSGILEDYIAKEEKEELQEIVHTIMNCIPSHSVDIIDRYYFQDQTYIEISEESNVPIGTVKSRLFQAKKIFTAQAEEYKERLTVIIG